MAKALVMSGGGAKGAFQAGMLLRLKPDFDHVYGTSTGALNAAGIAIAGLPVLEQVWDGIEKMSDIYLFQWWTLGPLFGGALHSYKPLLGILKQTILGKTATMDVTVTKVNILTGELVYHTLRKGEVCDEAFMMSVLASTCVPFHSNPVDRAWFDGGVREITPLRQAIEDGYRDITVIMTNPFQINLDPAPEPGWFLRGVKLGLRAIDVVSHEITVSDVKSCILKNRVPGYDSVQVRTYAPPVQLTETDGFTQPQIQAAKSQGRDSLLIELKVEKLSTY